MRRFFCFCFLRYTCKYYPQQPAAYLSVADNGFRRVLFEQLHTLLPLVHVVRILPQEDGTHLFP